jgi:hypothetical protein
MLKAAPLPPSLIDADAVVAEQRIAGCRIACYGIEQHRKPII